MRFVTFQPYDWETSKRKEEWHDIYWDMLGFDPVWCIPAESLEQALINGLLTCPTTPEKAIFFKTNNFHIIPKIEHYNYLVTDKPDNGSDLLSCKKLKSYLEKRNNNEDVLTFLSKTAPYQFEYLVLPDTMNIKAEIDIDKRLQEAIFDNNCDCKQEAEKIIEQQIKNAKMYFHSTQQPDWFTEERCVRNDVANLKWKWYVQDNDFFINDYKKVFGMCNEDRDVTIKKINPHNLDRLVDLLNKFPSEKNFYTVIKYLKTVMYHDGCPI